MVSDQAITRLIDKIKWQVTHPGEKPPPSPVRTFRCPGTPLPLPAAPVVSIPPDFGEQIEVRYSYVMPLRWSLSFALTDKLWRNVRERHKELFPGWERCDCPNGCNARSLDEHWDYDHIHHLKTFVGAKFICSGCHWLKSPGFRLNTWRKPPPLMSFGPPHIIACLGWTQDRVDALQRRDLAEHHFQQIAISQIGQRIQEKRAVALPSPLERMEAVDVQRLVRPGQIVIVPWRVDLRRLSDYGYSPEEVKKFENRMYVVAAKRLESLELFHEAPTAAALE